MSETTRTAQLADPFTPDLTDIMPPMAQAQNTPMILGARSDQAMAEIVTAQHVAEKRDYGRVAKEFKQLCVAAGSKFFYRWEVNDKNSRTGKSVVEGPSIEMAMAVVGAYGNCRVSAMPVMETQTHVVFAARFIDYERGVTIERTFQQRKNQSLGMRDADRAADLVFQIGQSKAMRNVVVAALKTLCEQGMGWAKSGVLERVGRNPDAARTYLTKKLQEMDIPLKRAEYVLGKVIGQWIATDMARLYSTLQTIEDGFSTIEEEFPPPQAGDPGPVVDQGPANTGTTDTGTGEAAQKKTRGPNKPKETPASTDAGPQGGTDGKAGQGEAGIAGEQGATATPSAPDPTPAATPPQAATAGEVAAAQSAGEVAQSPAGEPNPGPVATDQHAEANPTGQAGGGADTPPADPPDGDDPFGGLKFG